MCDLDRWLLFILTPAARSQSGFAGASVRTCRCCWGVLQSILHSSYCIPYTAEFRTLQRGPTFLCSYDYRVLRWRSMHYLHCIHGSALHSGSCHTTSKLWIGTMSARGHYHDESLRMSNVYQLLFHSSGEVSHLNCHLNRPARANYIFSHWLIIPYVWALNSSMPA